MTKTLLEGEELRQRHVDLMTELKDFVEKRKLSPGEMSSCGIWLCCNAILNYNGKVQQKFFEKTVAGMREFLDRGNQLRSN
jgi:hypothetical protein